MEFSVCIRCLVLTVALWLSTVDALMFHLSPNHRKCLKEEIHKDVLVTGDYELSDAPGQIANLKVGFDVNVQLCENYARFGNRIRRLIESSPTPSKGVNFPEI